jgi:hypothetical protein
MSRSKIVFPALAGLMLAVPALAQERQPSLVKLEIVDVDADFAIVLLSAADRTMEVQKQQVLADAQARLASKKDGGFVVDLEVPGNTDAEIWWQAITYDAVAGFRVRPVQKLDLSIDTPVDFSDVTMRQPAPEEEKSDPTKDSDAPKLDPTKPDSDVDAALGLSLSLAIVRDDTGRATGLRAWFEAPSDGYGLMAARVTGGETTDVWLYRKLPGAGEGMRDVVEMHEALAALGKTGAVRVFLAHGTAAKPLDDVAWRQIALIRL